LRWISLVSMLQLAKLPYILNLWYMWTKKQVEREIQIYHKNNEKIQEF
jgi:hypothetical protein